MEKNKGLDDLLNMNPGYVKNVTLLPGQTVISLTLFTYNLMKAIYIFLLIDLGRIVKYCGYRCMFFMALCALLGEFHCVTCLGIFGSH